MTTTIWRMTTLCMLLMCLPTSGSMGETQLTEEEKESIARAKEDPCYKLSSASAFGELDKMTPAQQADLFEQCNNHPDPIKCGGARTLLKISGYTGEELTCGK